MPTYHFQCVVLGAYGDFKYVRVSSAFRGSVNTSITQQSLEIDSSFAKRKSMELWTFALRKRFAVLANFRHLTLECNQVGAEVASGRISTAHIVTVITAENLARRNTKTSPVDVIGENPSLAASFPIYSEAQGKRRVQHRREACEALTRIPASVCGRSQLLALRPPPPERYDM